MSPRSTIFKAKLQIADMSRHYYRDHALTLARHPSETDERMMLRLLAFALHADETLAFANGLTVEDEPDLWQKDLRGDIALWIDVGLPHERLVRRACGRAGQVILYTYGGRSATLWWDQNEAKLARLGNLTVLNVASDTSRGLAQLANRQMQLNCTIQEGQIWIADSHTSIEVTVQTTKSADPSA